MKPASLAKLLSGSLSAPLAPGYVLYGEETLLTVEALDAIRAGARAQGMSARERFDGASATDWQAAIASLMSMGLFGERTLIEIQFSAKPGKDSAARLVELAQAQSEDAIVVVVLPKLERAATQSAWFGALAQTFEIFEARPVTAAELPGWLKKRLHAAGLTISDEALTLLSQRVEGNLLAARQEVEKLALNAASPHLELSDIQAAVANLAQFDPFHLARAWMSADAPQLMRLLEIIEAQGDEPNLALWAITEDLRSLIRFKAGLSQGESTPALCQRLRLWGDKQMLAPQAATRLSTKKILTALQACALADRQIKGAAPGPAWPTVRQLLLNLTQ